MEPDQGHLRHRPAGAQEVHQADRLQRHSACRRVHGFRRHQGRMEDDGGDQEDPRSQDQAHRDLRAGAGVRRPFGGGQYRVRAADLGRGSARDAARGAGLSGCRQARGWRLCDAGRMRRRIRDLYFAHPRGHRRSRTASICGSCPTICARARRSTRCRSPRPSSIAGSCGRQPEGEWPTSSRSRFAAR